MTVQEVLQEQLESTDNSMHANEEEDQRSWQSTQQRQLLSGADLKQYGNAKTDAVT